MWPGVGEAGGIGGARGQAQKDDIVFNNAPGCRGRGDGARVRDGLQAGQPVAHGPLGVDLLRMAGVDAGAGESHGGRTGWGIIRFYGGPGKIMRSKSGGAGITTKQFAEL